MLIFNLLFLGVIPVRAKVIIKPLFLQYLNKEKVVVISVWLHEATDPGLGVVYTAAEAGRGSDGRSWPVPSSWTGPAPRWGSRKAVLAPGEC